MTHPARTAFAHLDARLDPRSPAPLAVAVSGGGDSVALLHLTNAWALRCGRPLHVLTVDHRLHPDSSRWTAAVARAAAALNRPVQILAWTGPKPLTGLPAAARAARHALLADAARELGARVILLGHTADDLAESAWMRARGSNLGELRPWSPSPAWPEGRGLMLLRPLLDIARADLRAWLGAQGVPWLEDPANADVRFARSRARAALQLSDPDPAPVRPVGDTEPDPGVARLFDLDDTLGLLSIPRSELQAAAPGARALLAAALLCASGGVRPPRGQAVTNLLSRLSAEATFTATLSGARLHADPDVAAITRDPGRRPPPEFAIKAGETRVWDGRFEVTAEVAGLIRPAAGRLARLSREDRARLSSIPPWARPTLPVLETRSGDIGLASARPLAAARLRAALGAFPNEAELPAEHTPSSARSTASLQTRHDRRA